MLRWLRRFIWLGLIGGVGAAAYTVWHRRQAERPAAGMVGRPNRHRCASSATNHAARRRLHSAGRRSIAQRRTARRTDDRAEDSPAPTWVAPVDGACPSGYPIKGNANSLIYHVPGGRFYDRTVPERCYASAADAEADGYRAAKS